METLTTKKSEAQARMAHARSCIKRPRPPEVQESVSLRRRFICYPDGTVIQEHPEIVLIKWHTFASELKKGVADLLLLPHALWNKTALAGFLDRAQKQYPRFVRSNLRRMMVGELGDGQPMAVPDNRRYNMARFLRVLDVVETLMLDTNKHAPKESKPRRAVEPVVAGDQ